jgi:hypothetical protein
MEASKAGSSKAQALWQECLVLEKKLKAVLRWGSGTATGG